MGILLKLLLGSGDKEKKDKGKASKKSIKLEKEMEAYGLSEEEKKLVRSGEYDPWDFEEDEMEEDSYYSDDT